MAKKNKQTPKASGKKILLKEIEHKLAELTKDYHKRISDKKFAKKVRKAGRILSKSLTKETITVAHKKKEKTAKSV